MGDVLEGLSVMLRSPLFTTISALSIVVAAQSANAADATVPFTGTVLSTCLLTVGTPGVLAASGDYTTLASTNAGGVSGSVTALATGGNFKISAIAPTAFTAAPVGGGDNVSFATQYSGTGATSIGSTPGTTQTTLSQGATVVSVDLNAAKSSGAFAGGAYAATVTVRCE